MNRERGPNHRCLQCEKDFPTPSKLQLHSLIHTGKKLFACDLCPGRFIQQVHLRHHRSRVHGKIAAGVNSTDMDNTSLLQLEASPGWDGEQHKQKLFAVKKEEEMEIDPEKQVESMPHELGDYSAKKPDFDHSEATAVLRALSLNFGIFGDFLVVMNGKADVIISGEPYLALQLWFNMVSGKLISRVWSQTVACSWVVNITQFEEVCRNYFQCRPCVGYILGDKEQQTEEFIISQTPVPRKIYRGCKKVLDKNIPENRHCCQQCLRLETPIQQMQDSSKSMDIKADMAKSVENQKGKGNAMYLANQALYLQEIANKYPHVIESGRPFKVQIRTEDSKGLFQDKVLLVDPTKTLQQGGMVETVKEEDSTGFTIGNQKMDMEQRMNVNERAFHGKKEFQCKQCGKGFQTPSRLKCHHHQCNLGEKLALNGSSPTQAQHISTLRTHCVEFSHNSPNKDSQKEKKFACESEGCHFVTNNKWNIKKHCASLGHYSSVCLNAENQHASDKVQQSQKKFACDSEGCHYVTNRKFNLKKHCASLSHYSSIFLDAENLEKLPEKPDVKSVKKFGDTNRKTLIRKKCDVCGKMIPCGMFGKHMLEYHGEKREYYKQCHICSQAFSTNSIRRHYLKYHNYGNFKCMKCGFAGNFPNELADHIAKCHSDDQLVRCPACKKDQTIADIDSHYKICINEKLRRARKKHKMCETCGKMIKLDYYYRHTKIHLRQQILNGKANIDAKDLFYNCDKCEKRFGEKKQLKEHVRYVHDKLVLQCELCPMTFNTISNLYSHKKEAHEETRYECQVCHMKFAYQSKLSRHELIHSEAQFECKFCKKILKTQETLEHHERYHTGEKPFKCVHCTNSYVSRKALRQHLAGAHSIIGVRGGKAGWKKTAKLQEQF